MAKKYYVGHVCDCGEELIQPVIQLGSKDEDPKEPIVFVTSLSQMDFTCHQCGAEYATGDMEVQRMN